jgi:hypothetical protein
MMRKADRDREERGERGGRDDRGPRREDRPRRSDGDEPAAAEGEE